MHNIIFQKFKKYRFLFEELVKRDFKKKYKQTALGFIWSLLSPLMTLTVMALVFTTFFGRNTPHFIIYLFCGNMVFTYFNESTTMGMVSLLHNAHIFTKVNIPKYMFLLSRNITSLINFGLTLIIFFIFCIFDGITFTWSFFLLLYPIGLLILFNIGMGLILSAVYVFFRDLQYLYDIFKMMIMYLSAIFYTTDAFGPLVQKLFYINPVYSFISYFREIVLYGAIPSVWHHLLILGYAALVLVVGMLIYHKKNYRFLYYI